MGSRIRRRQRPPRLSVEAWDMYVQNTAHKESNFRISVCEYDAPTTMLGSAAFEETFLGLFGLLRQKGEVLLLKMVSWGLC